MRFLCFVVLWGFGFFCGFGGILCMWYFVHVVFVHVVLVVFVFLKVLFFVLSEAYLL